MPRPKPVRLDPSIFGTQVVHKQTGEVFPSAEEAIRTLQARAAQEIISAAREVKLAALTDLLSAALAGKVGEKAIKIVAEACYEKGSELTLILSDDKKPAAKRPSFPAAAPAKKQPAPPAAKKAAPPPPPAGGPPKRGRGRPPKAVVAAAPVAPAKRGRGRPVKAPEGAVAKKASAAQSSGKTASAPTGDHQVPAPVATTVAVPPALPVALPPPPPSQADFERVQQQAIPQTALPPPPPFAAVPPPLPVAADPFAK